LAPVLHLLVGKDVPHLDNLQLGLELILLLLKKIPKLANKEPNITKVLIFI
jgi:hypothetical protein